MSRLFTAAIATSLALGLSAGVATAADTEAQQAPSAHKAMWKSCVTAGDADRERCMLTANVKDSAAGRQCNDMMSRAQRRCMLDFLEAKHPVAGAK
jgi:hypothetical protein